MRGGVVGSKTGPALNGTAIPAHHFVYSALLIETCLATVCNVRHGHGSQTPTLPVCYHVEASEACLSTI